MKKSKRLLIRICDTSLIILTFVAIAIILVAMNNWYENKVKSLSTVAAKDAMGEGFEEIESYPSNDGNVTIYVFEDNVTGINYLVSVSISADGTVFASTPVPRMTNTVVNNLPQYYTTR